VTVAMYASILLMPLFLQNFRGLGAMDTGLIMFPQALAAGLVMPISGRLFDKIGPRPLILFGLLLLAYATWQLRALDVTTSNMTIRGILVMRGVSMGFIMMPAMTVAMNSLPHHLISRGSSLSNVLRQLFGSFGTAIFVTLLQTRQTYHQAMLSQTMTPDVPGVRAVLQATQHYLMHEGLTAAHAKAAGVLALYQQVALRAAVLSFEDCFLIAAGTCLLALIPAMFLRTTGARRSGGMVLE
jgi:MFS family permease